jgi:DNA-directed RNA polymerase subunit RPC12/RpoP
MAEKRVCSECEIPLKDDSSTRCLDVTSCEHRALLKAKQEIVELKASVNAWKDAWYNYRDLVGRMHWQNYSPLPETKETIPDFEDDNFRRFGKLLLAKIDGQWKEVASGASLESVEAVIRLMSSS